MLLKVRLFGTAAESTLTVEPPLLRKIKTTLPVPGLNVAPDVTVKIPWLNNVPLGALNVPPESVNPPLLSTEPVPPLNGPALSAIAPITVTFDEPCEIVPMYPAFICKTWAVTFMSIVASFELAPLKMTPSVEIGTKLQVQFA